MRLKGQRKMGYYPTPPLVVERLRPFLAFPEEAVTCLDPCCGTGLALATLVQGREAGTFGVELDAGRAKEAREVLDRVLHSSFEETRISPGVFSLLFLNPPYDWEEDSEAAPAERKELTFLRTSIKHLQPGGVLIYLIPRTRLDERIARLLAYGFEDLSIYQFPKEEYEPFRQVCILGRKKARDGQDPEEMSRLLDAVAGRLKELPGRAKPRYTLPPGKKVPFFRSSRADLETLSAEVAQSPLWKQLTPHPFHSPLNTPAPPLPLHTGHLGLLMAAGCLNGVVGEGEDRHVVAGKVEKFTIESEEFREDGTHEARSLERYRVTIKLLFPSGEIRTLT